MFFATKLNQMHDDYDAGAILMPRPAGRDYILEIRIIVFTKFLLDNSVYTLCTLYNVHTFIFKSISLRHHFVKDVIIRERRRRQCWQLEYVFLHDCYYSFHLKYFKIF